MKNINDEGGLFSDGWQKAIGAFRFFFEKYYVDLCNFVNIYLNDPATAEDIVQDVYVYFWNKRKYLYRNFYKIVLTESIEKQKSELFAQ